MRMVCVIAVTLFGWTAVGQGADGSARSLSSVSGYSNYSGDAEASADNVSGRQGAHFPEPLAPTRGDVEGDMKRGQAMEMYVKGVALAEERHEFNEALRQFRQALVMERSSTVLYGIAQCKKALNSPLEALFMFANTLSVDARMPPEERLPEEFANRARSQLNEFLAQLASVRIRIPDGEALRKVTLNGAPVVSTDLFQQLGKPILVAGNVPRWVPRSSFTFPGDFVFFVQPGLYDIEFTFEGGARRFVEKRRLLAKGGQIDLGTEPIPAKLLIENILPGTNIQLKAGDRTLVDREFETRRKTLAVSGLANGAYVLEASRSGFVDYRTTVQLTSGEKKSVVLDLQPRRAIRSWKLWLPIGLVLTAGIVTAVVIATASKEDAPPAQNGEGLITIGVF